MIKGTRVAESPTVTARSTAAPRRTSARTEHPRHGDELLTASEVVDFLKLASIQVLYYWNSEGTGPPAFRVGKHLRYWLGDVLLWLDELQRAAS
jgi:hypothetical protein